MQKQLEGTPKYINEQCEYGARLMGNSYDNRGMHAVI